MPPARSRVLLLVLPAIVLTSAGTAVSILVLGPPSPVVEVLEAVLLAVGYARMALTASQSMLGLAIRRPVLAVAAGEPVRTALLLPIYNEAPAPVAAAAAVMAEALNASDGVTMFILSDTQEPCLIAAEASMFPLRAISRSGVAMHYRRRTTNAGRKAGNIGAFCRDIGRGFDYAIVLDADSVMTADAIRALIKAMQSDARAGLIQSVTYPVGGRTLFGRMQQFSARLNTPLTVAGQDLWQQRRGTFWGHNAILRLAPFTAHATLPVLSGRPPMGGEVLCHDTIEAALLLRAGWEVRSAVEIAGSYETTPSNLIDHLARERRWCQGNMQHLRLLAAPRFVPESRLHILIGILHYISAPAGLLLSVILLTCGRTHEVRADLASICTWLTLALLLGPRSASLARALASRGVARSFGGRARLVFSACVEQLSTVLTAPIFMISITGFVVSTFAGRVVRWDAPARGDRAVGWAEAWRRFRWHTALGVAAALACGVFRPAVLPWLAPFLVGLVVSIPLGVCSGSVKLGMLARRAGLFLTEDELAPPAELAAVITGSAPGHRWDRRANARLVA